MRWGPGPVFIYDCLATSRRWQIYAIRSVGVLSLLVAMATIAYSQRGMIESNSWREYARLGEYYFYAMIGVELALVMLAAPAAAAGAICLDRARGTLAHMLMTDLSDAEVVLGKLAARLLPVLGLVACSWPVLAISSLLGGIDPRALTMAFAVILAVALLGCTLALTLSVWARKPHEVVLVTYTAWVLVLLIWPIWHGLSTGGLVRPPSQWTLVANPYYLAFAPYAAPGRINSWDYLGFFTATVGTSGLLTVLSVFRMRPVARRGTIDNRRGPALGRLGRLIRWLPGPSLDRNPVLWREWHRSRPSPWMMALLILVGLSTSVACVIGAASAWAVGVDPVKIQVGVGTGVFGYIFQMLFGLLILSAVAPMSMSEERQRGSLDVLATTTLSSRSIVVGKWLGMYRLVALLTIGPGLMALALATAHKDPPKVIAGLSPIYYTELSSGERYFGVILLVATILCHGALINSLGLALAMWMTRQGRAIASSVGAFVFLAIGWPIFAEVARIKPGGRGLLSLSPVMAAGEFADLFSIRTIQLREVLWWVPFWDVMVGILAIGLLHLTVRTFDSCFDRIPADPDRAPLLADVVVVLAVLVGAGGLFGAAGLWVYGVRASQVGFEMMDGIVCMAISLAIGFLMVCAIATISMSARRPPGAHLSGVDVNMTSSQLVLNRWWRSFRLVLLLAIGPAMIALAMATTYRDAPAEPSVMILPTGAQVVTSVDASGTPIVTTIDPSGNRTVRLSTAEEIAAAGAPLPWEPTLPGLIDIAALIVFTVLVHGAVASSVGLALGILIGSRRRAIVVGLGLLLLVAIGGPCLVFLVFDRELARYLCLMSPAPSIGLLLAHLGMRSDVLQEIVCWVGIWDAIMLIVAVGFLWLSVKVVGRASGPSSAPRRRIVWNNIRPRAANHPIGAPSGDGHDP